MDLRRNVFSLRNARPEREGQGKIYPRRTEAARPNQYRVVEGISLFHLRPDRRQETKRCIRRSRGLLARVRSEEDRAYLASDDAAQASRIGQSACHRSLRPGILR